MRVKELINKLQEFPDDMPVATIGVIEPEVIDDPDFIAVNVCTWKDYDYPYNKPSFDYVNLE